MNEKRAKMMGEEKIPKLLLKLALPAIVGMLVSAIYNVVDTLFVSKLGTQAIGAVSVAFPLFLLISAIGLMYGVGSASFVSRLLGEGRKEKADIVTSTTFFTSLATGVLLSGIIYLFLVPILRKFGATDTILPYAYDYAKILTFGAVFTVLNMTMNNLLRAEGSAKKAMMSLLVGAVLNIILDPLFIFTFNMGVVGAAVATVISQMLSTMLILSFFLKKQSLLHLSYKLFKPTKELYMELYKIGLPTFIRQALMSYSMGLLNISAKEYGDAAIASFGVSGRVFSLAAMVLFGFAQGFQPVAGFNFGAKKIGRLKEAIRTAVNWTTIFAVISTVLYFVFTKQLLSIFSKDADVISYGVIALRSMCLVFPFFGFQVIYGTLFQAIGKGKEAAFLSLARQGIFFIPAILILPKIFNLNGIYAAQPVADALTVVLTAFLAIKLHVELNKSEELIIENN